MKRTLLALSLASLSVGCSIQKASKSVDMTPSARSEAIPNEFVFRGDRDLVATYLKSMGVSADISNVAKGVDLYQVKYKGDVDLGTIAGGLEGKVDYVEPNYRIHTDARVDKYSWPNDKYFFKQWALNNIGQNAPFGLPGTEAADIDFLQILSASKAKGGKKIIVGVVDTGIDYTHPDLKENMWVNKKEAPENGGVAGRDDDGNGLIDDIYGYDYYSAGGGSANKYGAPGDSDPMDESGHGTHCAGTIAASIGNAEGIVGMNANVELMALRFLGDGGGSTVDATRAIYYAIDKGANVLSNSWGGGGDSKALRDAIADAEKAGILFVAAAGNDGKNIDVEDTFPASIDKDSRGRLITNVLAVGASDNQDNPASFSNYGHQHVHVFAPGVAILSTYPVKMRPSQPYAVMSGTSMATPFAAGLAALMMASNPSLIGKPNEVRQIMMQTSDSRDSLIGKAVSNGRINAARALQAKGTQVLKPNWLSRAENIQEKGFQKEVVDIRREIKVAGAKAIRVHFDFIQIEKPYDSIYLYDSNLRLIANVEDVFTRDHWSAVIPGDKVTVRFTNSLVQQITMGMAPPQTSEAGCMSLGAEEVIKVGPTEFKCMTDTQDSSGTKTYATFNSQGFSIDRVEYIPADGEKR